MVKWLSEVAVDERRRDGMARGEVAPFVVGWVELMPWGRKRLSSIAEVWNSLMNEGSGIR